MAGRKPKPSAMKTLAGNPGKRALNDREPKPPAAGVRAPRGKLPEEGKQLWRALAPMLSQLGVLTEADLPALEMLCLHYAVARDAYAVIQEEGLTVETTDSVKKHPAASVFRENSAMFRSYLSEFGLTPASRTRIQVGPAEEEKSLAEMLFDAAVKLDG